MGFSLRLRSGERAAGIACATLLCAACSPEDNTHPNEDAGITTDASHPPGCPTNSGFAGDELCIDVPDPPEGIQLHFGPSDYDNLDEVTRFVVHMDESVTDCFFLKAPNNVDMPVGEIHIRMRPDPGSTLILYANVPDHADGLGPCPSGAAPQFWVGSRSERFDFPPPGSPIPEDAGIAKQLPARSQLAIQVHFENAEPDPILREAWLNLLWHDADTVTDGFGTMFLIGGIFSNIAPGTRALVRGSSAASQDSRIVLMAGHFHTHTRRLTVWKAVGNEVGDAGQSQLSDAGATPDAAIVPFQPPDWGTGTRTQLLEAYDWADPGTRWFDSVNQNPVPNPDTKQGGAVSGPVQLNQGDRIEWECEVVNDLSTPITFSNELRTGEMCIVSGGYVPADHSLDPAVWAATQ
jgi:hypothetical protein